MPIRTPPPAWADDHDNATMVRTAPPIKTILAFMANPPAQAVIRSTYQSLCSAEKLELDRTADWKAGEHQFFSNFHYRQDLPTGIMLTDFVTLGRYALTAVGIWGSAVIRCFNNGCLNGAKWRSETRSIGWLRS
jgi:hypothetical protein